MEASRFLATTLWICAEQNVGEPEREGRRSIARTMSSTMPQVFFARRVDLKRGNKRVWLKSVLVEQNGKIRVVSVRKKIGRYVRNMVTGFLKDNCMEFTTGSRDNIGRISARRAWIPL